VLCNELEICLGRIRNHETEHPGSLLAPPWLQTTRMPDEAFDHEVLAPRQGDDHDSRRTVLKLFVFHQPDRKTSF